VGSEGPTRLPPRLGPLVWNSGLTPCHFACALLSLDVQRGICFGRGTRGEGEVLAQATHMQCGAKHDDAHGATRTHLARTMHVTCTAGTGTGGI
jgi:hypothetical protein